MEFHFKFFRLPLAALALVTLLSFICSCDRSSDVKKIPVGDIEIAYYTRGSGDPLVMIMGFRGTMGVWDPALLDELEKHFTLILFDNRGIGMSTDTAEDKTTIQQMADDTAGLITALGYKKANVLGWSMGSRIAMELAIHHPEMVEHLILCSPNPGKREVPRETGAYAKLLSGDTNQEKILSMIFPRTPEGMKAEAEYVTRLAGSALGKWTPDDLNVSPEVVKRQARAVTAWAQNDAAYQALPNLKIPTLVTTGLLDALDPAQNAQIVAYRIPFAWTAFFSGAGHAFLFQESKKFADLVILFTESTKAPMK